MIVKLKTVEIQNKVIKKIKPLVPKFIIKSRFYNILAIKNSNLLARSHTLSNTFTYKQLDGILSDKTSIETLRMIINNRLHEYNSDYYIKSPQCQYFCLLNDLKLFNDYQTLITFFDFGAYDGDSIENFLAHFPKKLYKGYLFEPDFNNFKCLTDYIENSHLKNKLEAYNQALYTSDSHVSFDNSSTSGSKIDSKGRIKVETRNLNSLLQFDISNRVLLKFDIEGAELDSLRNGVDFINFHRPVMLVCIYHKLDDLSSIPFFVNENFIEYNLYIRHHSKYNSETVLYCVPKELLVFFNEELLI